MWLVWVVSLCSAALAAAVVASHRRALTAAPRSWALLAWSGIPLTVGGLGLVVRFWEPTRGPYLANAVYPLGPYVNAWAVSFGFMWLAFGLVFYALALEGTHSWRTWFLLFVAWVLAWLPHGIIGVGFAAAGSNQPSIEVYRSWANRWPGLLLLGASAVILLTHFGLALIGFALTGHTLWRAGAPRVNGRVDP